MKQRQVYKQYHIACNPRQISQTCLTHPQFTDQSILFYVISEFVTVNKVEPGL